jgi:hypothetical protein
MTARVGVLAALCLAVLALAPSGGAAKGRIAVDPARPFVGVRAAIEVHAKVAAPLYVTLVSPTGFAMRVRMTRVLPGLWRLPWHFVDDGQWIVRVPRTHAVAHVYVTQAPGALPPFNMGKASPSVTGAWSGLAGTGIFFGR